MVDSGDERTRGIRWKTVFRFLLGGFFVFAGINHFRQPEFYAALIPPFLPFPMFLVYASGVAEILCGAGLFFRDTARMAAWGTFATLLAVYPANIYHAVSGGLEDPALGEMMANPVMAWVRLPLQFVFLAWAYWMTRPETAGKSGVLRERLTAASTTVTS